METNRIFQCRPRTFSSLLSNNQITKFIIRTILVFSILAGNFIPLRNTALANTNPIQGSLDNNSNINSPLATLDGSETKSSAFPIHREYTTSQTLDVTPPATLWLADYTNKIAIYSKDGTIFSASGFLDGANIRAIASAPGDKNTAYYLTETNKLWKTTDGGTTFALLSNLTLTAGNFQDVFINPANPQEVFVYWTWALNGNADTHFGALYRSLDGGYSWVKEPNIGQGNGIYAINDSPMNSRAMMNSEGAIILLGDGSISPNDTSLPSGGTSNAVVWRSMDHGQTWQLVWNTDDAIADAYRLSYARNHPSTWYAAVTAPNEDVLAGVIVSSDNGLSWDYRQVFQNGSSFPKVFDVAVDSYQPDTALALVEGQGIFRTEDGGLTWNQVEPDTGTVSVNMAWRINADPNVSGAFWLVGGPFNGDVYQGLYRSGDYGETWTQVYNARNVGGNASTGIRVDFDIAAPAIVPLISITDSDGSACPARYGNTQEPVGGPINPLTGGYDYRYEDLSLDTLAGPLSFQRTYSSLALQYPSSIGQGWTHNHDLRLIFPDANHPESTPGYVIFKGESSNRYLFLDLGNDAFAPYPGLCSTLVKQTDAQGIVTYQIEESSSHTRYIFDAGGKIQQRIDAQGFSWSYEYDPATQRLIKVFDAAAPASRYLSLAYDVQGRLTSVGDGQRSVSFGYATTAQGDDVLAYVDDVYAQLNDGQSHRWQYIYDPDHPLYLAEVKNPSGTTVERTEYDFSSGIGRAVRQFDGLGNQIFEISFNPITRQASIKDALYNYNDSTSDDHIYTQNYSWRNTLESSANPYGNETSKNYDDHFNPQAVSDPNQNTTAMRWSEDGIDLNEIVDPLGNATQLDYDPATHLVTTILDPLQHETTYTYDGLRLETINQQLGGTQVATTTYTYTTAADAPQPAGLIKQVVDPSGVAIAYQYYETGNLWKVTHSGQTTTYTYDGFGRVQSVTEPTGQVRWSCYDLAGRMTRSVSSTSAPVGDPCDVALYTPRAEDRVQDTVYDAVGNPILTTAPDGVKTRTYYDANNRPFAVVFNWTGIDLSNNTPPDRDPTHPDQNIRTDTVYDKAGNVIATIAPDGVITRTYYDEANRPVFVTDNLVGQALDETDTAPPAYDPNAPDQNVTTQTIYDDAGNPIVTVAPDGIKTRTYYDANNRPFAVVENWTGADLTDNTPPDRDLAHPDQNVRSDTFYDAAGNVIATVDPNGVLTRAYFDPLHRLEYRVQNMPLAHFNDSAYADTPPFELASPDENIITQAVYDYAGKQLASIFYAVDPDNPANQCQVTKNVDAQTGQVTVTANAYCIVTRNYYDAAGRPTVTVQNLVGQAIEYGPTAGAATPPPYVAPDQNVPGPTTVYDTTGRAIAKTLPNLDDPNNPANRIVNRTYFDAWGRAIFTVQNLIPNNGQDPLGDTPPDVPGYDPNYPDQNAPTAETRYDEDGRAIASIDALGVITRTYYDPLGRVSKVTRNLKDPNNPAATVEQLLQLPEPPAYDNSNPDRADWNITTETIYDIAGQAIAVITAPETGCTVTRQADDSVTATAACSVTRTYYDRLGRAYAVVRNYTGQAITDEDLPPGELRTPEANVIAFTVYAENSRAIATIDPNPVCAASHAQTGSWSIGENCVIHRAYYDALGRVVAQVKNLTGQSYMVATPPEREPRQPSAPFYIHPDQNVRTDFAYDPGGNQAGATDPNGVVTHFGYDALGRLTDVFENYQPGQAASVDVNVHTEYVYDAQGNRRAIRSANAVYSGAQDLTHFTYDRLGRLTGERDPLDHETMYSYNVLGNRSALLDAEGFETRYLYDRLGRLTTIDYPAPDADVQFSYGPTGLRMTMLDGAGTTTWAYDAIGQVKSVVDPEQQTVEYRYDGVGNRTRLIYPDQKTVIYDYDRLGRLETVTDWNNLVTSYTYAENGSLYQLSRPNGVVSTYTVNDVGWLTDLTHTGSEADLAIYHYAYEPVGNRWQAVETVYAPHVVYLPVVLNHGAGTQALGLEEALPEAGLDSITDPYPAPVEPDMKTEEEDPYPAPDASESVSQGTSFWEQVIGFFAWLFSPAEVVQASGMDQAYPPPGSSPPANPPALPAIEITYLYDPLHRLTQADDSSGSYFHYTYDSNGNRLTETIPAGTKTSSYDVANRLISVDGVSYAWDDNGNLANNGVYQYEYDHANRLTKVKNQAEATLATFTYNGLGDRIAEDNTHFVLDLNAGLTQVLQDETYMYLYGINRMMQQSATETDYFLPDALGSVRQLASAAGEVTLTQSFSPYGEQLSQTGAGASSFGFTGEWADSSVKLLFLRSRYYSDDMGRFLTRDTWQGDYTQPLSLNGWNYGYSNPVKYTDPSGMFPPQKLAEVFGLRDFSTLLDYFEDNGGRWGWLSLLLDAREGDHFTAIYPHLSGTYPEWAIYDEGILNTRATSFWSLAAQLDRLNCYDPSVNSNQKSSFCRRNEDPFFPMWRDSSPHIYALNGLSGKGYIDYAFEQSDLPDFKSYNGIFPSLELTLGVGGGVSFLVDSFGNAYVSGNVSGGLSMGIFTYSEGYLAASAYNAVFNGERIRVTDEDMMKNLMQGLCGGGSADIGLGVGAGACPGGTYNPGSVVYNVGANFGVSAQVSYTQILPEFSDKRMGWQHLYSYRRNGTTRADVERKALLQYGRCE